MDEKKVEEGREREGGRERGRVREREREKERGVFRWFITAAKCYLATRSSCSDKQN